MTPTQLRAFAAVVRLGSVKQAAAELQVSESAVSLHIGQLRRELGDQLFNRTGAGLAFTPGGLRLAGRSAELIGLQDRTILEVTQAGQGRRLLRVAASSLFAEHAAPGLLEAFSARAADLDVELSVCNPGRFVSLLRTRAADVAIGPRPEDPGTPLAVRPVMNIHLILVAGPEHPLAGAPVNIARVREQTWLLGPSAAGSLGAVPALLRRLGVPEEHQQIFQSHAAAVEEAKRNKGIAPVLSFAVAQDLAGGRLVRLSGANLHLDGVWHAVALAEPDPPPAAAELIRFTATPRAVQAMVKGAGVPVSRFRPAVHVTLWS
ncbi:LysR family transcriptional regulator [Mangrovihabitans endophyticus]|uniref:LysR family transcriptional regulator n=1 Tax=Mangrovihabitans endophyticus TaxID=1751298 RepID=A0A8J3C0C7_9ACTN|nr:LysR family transcriptional regulator [Mangrovihabitans endophyticus]GGL00679.1 LysR family transcriptional regulator [Mangrovihabitans endophyticus]